MSWSTYTIHYNESNGDVVDIEYFDGIHCMIEKLDEVAPDREHSEAGGHTFPDGSSISWGAWPGGAETDYDMYCANCGDKMWDGLQSMARHGSARDTFVSTPLDKQVEQVFGKTAQAYEEGDKVYFNGDYEGVVVSQYSENMYEVRSSDGRNMVTIDACDMRPREDKTAQTFNYTGHGWEGENYKQGLSTKEIAAKVRQYVKSQYPAYKFSVRYKSFSGGSAIDIALVSGPVDAFADGKTYEQLNQYYLDKSGLQQPVLDIMKDVNAFVSSFNFDDSDAMIDYFHTNFYIHLQVGGWDKPYTKTAQYGKCKSCGGSSISLNDDGECAGCAEGEDKTSSLDSLGVGDRIQYMVNDTSDAVQGVVVQVSGHKSYAGGSQQTYWVRRDDQGANDDPKDFVSSGDIVKTAQWDDDDDEFTRDEDDIATEDHLNFFQSGKQIIWSSDGETYETKDNESFGDMWEAITHHMEIDGFYPNVWFISDHGNEHLMSKEAKTAQGVAEHVFTYSDDVCPLCLGMGKSVNPQTMGYDSCKICGGTGRNPEHKTSQFGIGQSSTVLNLTVTSDGESDVNDAQRLLEDGGFIVTNVQGDTITCEWDGGYDETIEALNRVTESIGDIAMEGEVVTTSREAKTAQVSGAASFRLEERDASSVVSFDILHEISLGVSSVVGVYSVRLLGEDDYEIGGGSPEVVEFSTGAVAIAWGADADWYYSERPLEELVAQFLGLEGHVAQYSGDEDYGDDITSGIGEPEGDASTCADCTMYECGYFGTTAEPCDDFEPYSGDENE